MNVFRHYFQLVVSNLWSVTLTELVRKGIEFEKKGFVRLNFQQPCLE